jgi:hypothetical protein
MTTLARGDSGEADMLNDGTHCHVPSSSRIVSVYPPTTQGELLAGLDFVAGFG